MNFSSNTSEFAVYPLQERSKGEVIAETLVACVLFILGVTGNGLVCWVIHKKRYTSSSMYFFMLNLAYADLLVCFASIPLTLLATRPQPVVVKFGSVGCKVIRFVQYTLPPASIAILTATCIDRYFHICVPLRRIITTRATKQLAMVCWGFAIFLTLPIFFLIETVNVDYKGTVYEFCNIQETSSYPKAGRVYLVFRGLLGFAIPLAVTTVLYFKIVQTVWQRDSRHHSTNRQRANVVKSLLTVVVAFSMSWAPFSICNKYYLFVDFQKKITTRQEIITFWIGLSASVYNPVIYAFYNRKFRDAFVSVIFGRKTTQTSRAEGKQLPKHRQRSQTLPALLAIEVPKERGDWVFRVGDNTTSNLHGNKTRHLSLGFQPICEERKPQIKATIESKKATTIFVDDRISSDGHLAFAQERNEIVALEKLVLGNGQLTTKSENSNRELISSSYACANSSPRNDVFKPPTIASVMTNDKSRATGLANLIPKVQTNALFQYPSVVQRSRTFHFPDRNYVQSLHWDNKTAANVDTRYLDVTSIDVTRHISFSRYGADRTRFTRSQSFNGPRSSNLSRNANMRRSNDVSRL